MVGFNREAGVDMTDFFANRTVTIATMHQKEKAIAPLIEAALNVKTCVPQNFDTDRLGTFTREIQRPGDQTTTARMKAQAALEITGGTLAIASEGSFGPHPQIPFVPCNREIVLLLDTQHQLEIVGEVLSTDTNYQSQTVTSPQAALDFAQTVGFPEHGLVVLPAQSKGTTLDSEAIAKGITQEAALIAAVTGAIAQSANQSAQIETDMRALYNPTRMKVIAEATTALIQQINQHCPQCNYPGFAISQRRPGLPCRFCGAATLLTIAVVYRCQHCQFQKTQQFPDKEQYADPARCPYCNP